MVIAGSQAYIKAWFQRSRLIYKPDALLLQTGNVVSQCPGRSSQNMELLQILPVWPFPSPSHFPWKQPSSCSRTVPLAWGIFCPLLNSGPPCPLQIYTSAVIPRVQRLIPGQILRVIFHTLCLPRSSTLPGRLTWDQRVLRFEHTPCLLAVFPPSTSSLIFHQAWVVTSSLFLRWRGCMPYVWRTTSGCTLGGFFLPVNEGQAPGTCPLIGFRE